MPEALLCVEGDTSQKSPSMRKDSNNPVRKSTRQDATPPKPVDHLQPCSLLKLPGEIRNQIYHYVYNTERNVNMTANSTKAGYTSRHHARPTMTGATPTVIKATRCLSIVPSLKGTFYNKTINVSRIPGQKHIRPVDGIRWSSSPISLLLTCKMIADEAGTILYANTSFLFEDPRRLSAFLITTSARNLLSIRSLNIYYQAYGMPCLAVDSRWEQKHLERWISLLTMLAERVCNLERLYLDLHFPHLDNFLNRAFKNPEACRLYSRSDAGPLLLTLPLATLTQLKSIGLRISSNVLRLARNPERFDVVCGPQFALHGISTPFQQQKNAVFNDNLNHVEEVHDSLKRAFKRLISGTDDLEANFAELLVAVSDRNEWSKDPVGNSLRRANLLPALPIAPSPDAVVAAAKLMLATNPILTAPVQYDRRPWTELEPLPYTQPYKYPPLKNWNKEWRKENAAKSAEVNASAVSKKGKRRSRQDDANSAPNMDSPLITLLEEETALPRKKPGNKTCPKNDRHGSDGSLHRPVRGGHVRGASVDSAVVLSHSPGPDSLNKASQPMSALELLMVEMTTPAQESVLQGKQLASGDEPALSVKLEALYDDTSTVMKTNSAILVQATESKAPATASIARKGRYKKKKTGQTAHADTINETKLEIAANKKTRNITPAPAMSAGPSSRDPTKDNGHTSRNGKANEKSRRRAARASHNTQSLQDQAPRMQPPPLWVAAFGER